MNMNDRILFNVNYWDVIVIKVLKNSSRTV